MSEARVRLLLEGDAKGAQRALEQTQQAVADTQKTVTNLGRASDAASAEVIDLGEAAQTATREIVELAEAEQRATVQIGSLSKNSIAAKIAMGGLADGAGKVAKSVGNGPNGAAGAVGNLVAQFNDVGMMLMAGQNPLQLAIQQGSQISQVVGPMGAAGAVRALGGAFLGALNPVNLVIMGVIGGLGMLVQHLRSGKDEVLSLADAIDGLESATSNWKQALDNAQQPFGRLIEQFGNGAVAARDTYQALLELSHLEFLDKMEGGVNSLMAHFANLGQEVARWEQATSLPAFMREEAISGAQSAMQALQAQYGLTITEASRLNAAINELSQAQGPRQVADAAWRVAEEMKRARQEAGGASAEARTLEEQMRRLFLSAQNFATKMEDTVGEINAADAAAAQMADTMSAVKAEIAGIASLLASIGGGMIQNATKFAELQALRAGASAKEAVKQGQQLVREAERAAAGMGGSMVNRLARRAKVAVADVSDFVTEELEKEHQKHRDAERAARGGRGGGGRGGADRTAREAQRERQAVEDLIQSQQRELDVLRAKNPVQAEMIRHRETLANATSAERAQIEELISTRHREEAAAAALKEQWDFIGNTALDVLDGMILRGETAADVIDNLANMLARAALQAALLGTGPLAGIMGTAGTGGVVGAIGGSYASGGYITGPGSGVSDSIHIRASTGEFMVNAKATAQHRPVLEAINSGGLPGFAAGGIIGGLPMPEPPLRGRDESANGGTDPQVVFSPVFNPVNNSGRALDMEVTETTDSRGRRQYNLVLSDIVAAGISARGGAGDRTMKSQYGLNRMGIAR